jgi:hypothetical protein
MSRYQHRPVWPPPPPGALPWVTLHAATPPAVRAGGAAAAMAAPPPAATVREPRAVHGGKIAAEPTPRSRNPPRRACPRPSSSSSVVAPAHSFWGRNRAVTRTRAVRAGGAAAAMAALPPAAAAREPRAVLGGKIAAEPIPRSRNPPRRACPRPSRRSRAPYRKSNAGGDQDPRKRQAVVGHGTEPSGMCQDEPREPKPKAPPAVRPDHLAGPYGLSIFRM